MENGLPKGWEGVPIGKVFTEVKERVIPANGDDWKYIGLEHLSSGGGIENIGQGDDLKSQKTVFKKGDVLYGKLRPYLNKHAIVNFEGICSTDILVYRAPNLDSAKFLNYFFGTQRFIQFANSNSKGINLPRISPKEIANFPIPLPPLPEQHRIVAKLDAVLAKVGSARERMERLPGILQRFRQSVLAQAVSGKLTEGWREENPGVESAEELLERIKKETKRPTINKAESIFEVPDNRAFITLESLCYSHRPLTYGVIKLGEEVENGIPCLRTSDVRPLFFDTVGIKRISKQIADEYKRTYLEGGEILVNVRGTLGGVAVVPPEMKGFNISREVAMVPVSKLIDGHWLAYYIASFYAQNWLSGMTKGNAYIGINIKDLKNLPIPICPLPEQKEIVRRVQSLFAVADRLEERYEALKEKVEGLPQAVLAKAFRGELVPQEKA